LFLCQTLPWPPDGGVWIRTYHVLRLLARSFDITALCFERGGRGGRQPADQRRAAVEALGALGRMHVFPVPQTLGRARFLWDHLRSTLSGRVYTRFVFDSRDFRRQLDALLAAERFDLAHVDSLDLSAYLPALAGLPVVCVHHNVESQLLERRAGIGRSWRGWYLRRQARLMAREERRWCSRVALNVTVSAADAEQLRAVAPDAAFTVVPNGVDVDEFRPGAGAGDRLVYVGGTSWFPNQDALDFFCEAILPRLRAARRDLPLIQWIGAATPEQQRHYRERFRVELTGHVPDVRPYMRDSLCNLVPLRIGGGTRLKILNAWAMGNTVVSTSIGCEGLDAVDGENLLIADEPDAFAAAVLRALDDAALRRRIGAHARETAERTYSWDVIGGAMTESYLRLAGR
jgi:glycosyltransferase involved in cell wall biosynthesis